ncbi:hypothetical protein BegalDRAFT_0006 [Beggiatoa alba B18LD]|uniref:Uncharacterized protein n=1 Tax=Beggiatoa alba B18LD TaxID=395493 RepID=I3CL80_9GAMM|nr:hypothetical protein [Beggiatoa alba]EIJ44373.1 hypothetical protein BegalDRAFT_0006 [Beggiatoa alba B18LD]
MRKIIISILFLLPTIVLADDKKAFLMSLPFYENLVCKPDPYIVLEQVLRWEIEYLETPEILAIPESKQFLTKKYDDLNNLIKLCVENHNN